MTKEKYAVYLSYLKEFEELSGSGCELCCPADRTISPGRLARMMVSDERATYMRDMICDGEGRPVKINFMRVRYR